MRLLLTGGLGFIGANVCAFLLRNTDWQIWVLDVKTYAAHPHTQAILERCGAASMGAVCFVHGTINDQTLISDLLHNHAIDAVMHLAAESHVDRSIDGPDVFLQTNIMGTGSLLQACLSYWSGLPAARQDIFRFLHVSTDEVFGSLDHKGKFCETSPYRPNSPYAASKAGSDHLVRAWHETYGMPCIIANCCNNFGPFQFPEKLIPLALTNALCAEPIGIYGDGKNVRDWLYVDDHANALMTLLQEGKPGETYCVGAQQERTNLHVVQSICNILQEMQPGTTPYHDLITFITDRPGHDQRYAIDASKLHNETGWFPKTDFEQGLRLTIAWYLHNRDWWQYLREHVYDATRLGSNLLRG
ncbi:MAG: dTDP-glucose 4,6-dehydratase [Pseudomonadota bacterium]